MIIIIFKVRYGQAPLSGRAQVMEEKRKMTDIKKRIDWS